jgi:hypothetical protein
MNHYADFKRLLRQFDGKDHFMQSGHQTVSIRRQPRPCPPWMRNDEAVIAFLKKVFPLLTKSCSCSDDHDYCQRCKQLRQATMWMFVINTCFRRGKTATDAAYDWLSVGNYSLHNGPGYIRDIIRRIQRAYAGVRQDTGKAPSGQQGRLTNETRFARIVGEAEDVLAYNKVAVFALVSALMKHRRKKKHKKRPATFKY